MEKRGEIILYQPDSEVRLEVRLEDETVWLTQAQIVELFQSSKANISEHIKNIYEQGELDESSTVRDFRTVRQEGRRYVERVLLMLSKRNAGVKADIYTQTVSRQLQLDLQKHNSQYPLIEVHVCKKCHDRFLIIDGTDVWHIGASLKDLGKKMFAFSRLDIPATAITALL